MKKNAALWLFLSVIAFFLLHRCKNVAAPPATAAASPYRNHADTVRYVGNETCRTCHTAHYDSFVQTGMGQSFHFATPQKSAAQFGQHILVRDTLRQLNYYPFWRNDSLFVLEFRLEGKDTTHRLEQYIQYIVGSGQHTNSHIYNVNGFLRQAPVTFYTQTQRWDLAPGFGSGFNSRFSRIVGQECMSCHNSHAAFVQGSENKFDAVPLGIGCERCHGRGGLHVQEKMAGIVTDTSQTPDYSIVNPRRLPRELQMDVCRRCHAQGVTVLQDGKTFSDFLPGMALSSCQDVYLPHYDGAQTQLIMAAHADRLQLSNCYRKSEMTCLNCHNPHISVKQTPRSTFNTACEKCHNSSSKPLCSAPESVRQTRQNDCSGCHMEQSAAIDIPHVRIHDHFIRKPLTAAEKNNIGRFIGLACINNAQPTDLSKAQAYLHFYEQFNHETQHLDSAAYYIQRLQVGKAEERSRRQLLQIHEAYLRGDMKKIIGFAADLSPEILQDAWTAYRVGEAFLEQQQWQRAETYLRRAAELLPYQLDFQIKLAVALQYMQQLEAAEAILFRVIAQDPMQAAAHNNLGFVYFNLGKTKLAKQHYEQALHLQPDYVAALLNLAAWYAYEQETPALKKIVERILRIEPHNEKALALKGSLR
ncbi:MAG: tetratricopeptide repeat protein [Sphingobacteriales bacterium]|nr:tetratricopeptide repeat protein [Sphingobacteriales bacterium]